MGAFNIICINCFKTKKKRFQKPKKIVRENLGMFIIGCVVCGLYLTGYLYMIKYANDSHDQDYKRDIKKAKERISKEK